MKTNHDGTITLNAGETWISCLACGQRVSGDSIHTCSPQLKTLTDEEIWEVINRTAWVGTEEEIRFKIAEAVLRKAKEK
jgi:hypothetical protein